MERWDAGYAIERVGIPCEEGCCEAGGVVDCREGTGEVCELLFIREAEVLCDEGEHTADQPLLG